MNAWKETKETYKLQSEALCQFPFWYFLESSPLYGVPLILGPVSEFGIVHLDVDTIKTIISW